MVQLKWGICSAGLISFDFADALVSLPTEQHTVVAVAARDLERARKFAEQFGIPHVYDDYVALANDANVNAVYVGALQNQHYDLCKLFLNAGKHVLCEKALTCAAWQAEELMALAKTKNLFFMEAMWARCFPMAKQLRQILDNGEIGKVQFVEVHFTFDSSSTTLERLTKEELGGGAFWDIGVYALQFADLVFGGEQPSRVHAVGTLADNGVDVSASIVLQYSNGRFANLTISFCTAREVTATVHGSTAKLFVHEPFYTPMRFTITPRSGEPKTIDAEPLPHVKFPTKYTNSAGLVYEAMHVHECINRGLLESTLVPHSLSLWMQRTIDDCLRQLGRPRLPQRSDN